MSTGQTNQLKMNENEQYAWYGKIVHRFFCAGHWIILVIAQIKNEQPEG